VTPSLFELLVGSLDSEIEEGGTREGGGGGERWGQRGDGVPLTMSRHWMSV
jgi:hypothetical protein